MQKVDSDRGSQMHPLQLISELEATSRCQPSYDCAVNHLDFRGNSAAPRIYDWLTPIPMYARSLARYICLDFRGNSAARRIYDWLYAHSDVRTEFRQVYLFYFELFASNPGNRTGRLTAVKLISETSSGPSNELLLQVYGYASVGPGQDVVVAAFVPGALCDTSRSSVGWTYHYKKASRECSLQNSGSQ
jgi:hypothetical protein